MWTSRQPRAGPAPKGLPGPALPPGLQRSRTKELPSPSVQAAGETEIAQGAPRGQVTQASMERAWGHLLALPLTCSGTMGKSLTLCSSVFFI